MSIDPRLEFTANLIRYCQRVRAHSARPEIAKVAADFEIGLGRMRERMGETKEPLAFSLLNEGERAIRAA